MTSQAMTATSTLIFDLETAPLPDAEILAAFDESKVKYGNATKPETRAAKLEEARAKFLEDAALNPVTSFLLAAGIATVGGDGVFRPSIVTGEEPAILRRLWYSIEQAAASGATIIGFNIAEFDLPFALKRSWKYGMETPSFFRGRYLRDGVCDVRQVWTNGDRFAEGSSLDAIGKFLGIGGKPEGMNGKMFHEVWMNDREKAVGYLVNDLRLTWEIGRRMGVC
jgi:hypothetical protein